MMKRVTGAVLVLVMLFALAGCSVLYEKEYTSQRPYEAESSAPEGSGPAAPVSSITNYSSLKQAILQLVSERAESAELQFQNYDGNISQDISTACWEVKSSTALGAFAVDYISYDLSRIVSFYQAEIYITYKRSADQIAAVESVYTVSDLSEKLRQALQENRSYLVLEVTVASATADTVIRAAAEAYHADPLICPVLPEVDVGIYPESGVSRIMEITLSYGLDGETMDAMRRELEGAVASMARWVVPQGTASGEMLSEYARVQGVYMYVSENCRLNRTAGTTARDALVSGSADSEGLAMALMAGCQALDVDCSLVFGRLAGIDHVWNMVTVDGKTYHVDVSGGNGVFLLGDEAVWGDYWWDTSFYPACPETYSGNGESASPEPMI